MTTTGPKEIELKPMSKKSFAGILGCSYYMLHKEIQAYLKTADGKKYSKDATGHRYLTKAFMKDFLKHTDFIPEIILL